ncbi:MAG: hypothetical protein ABSB74_19335 [Tepidisphaeraceae bacterium]
MAETQETPSLPDPQSACNHLNDQVYAKVFFQKLAGAGFVPTNDKQAEKFLILADKLRALAEDLRGNAAAVNDPESAANRLLDEIMNQSWIGKPASV